jgi:hypothetical protein
MDDQNEVGEFKNLQGNIYSSFSGICSKILKSWTPKFFAKTSLGMCESQSVRRNVASSEKAPESKTRMNSAPSFVVFFAWMECGLPAGKYHRSPSL